MTQGQPSRTSPASFSEGLPQPRRTQAILALSAGALLLMIDASIANVVLPTIAQRLQIDKSATVLIVTAYQLILAMSLMPLAAVGARYGYRRLYQAGLALHSVAALLCLLVDSLPALLAVRSLQALGAAAATSVAVGLLRGTYPPRWLGRGLALNTAVNTAGVAAAPVVGGFVLAVADWQWAFVVATPFALVALALSRALPEPERSAPGFDLLGAALCALTFGMVIGGLEAAIHTDRLLLSLLVLAAGSVIGIWFVRHELRHPQPVFPVDLFGRPAIALAITATFAAVLASTLLMIYMPFRLQHGLGLGTAAVGGLMASYAIGTMICAPLAGALSDRLPVALLSTVGMVVATTGLTAMALLPAAPTTDAIAWRMAVCGAGFGLCFSPNARLIVGAVPLLRAAAAGSLYTTTRMVGLATGATLSAALLALGLGDGAGPLWVAAALTVLAAVVSAAGWPLRHRT